MKAPARAPWTNHDAAERGRLTPKWTRLALAVLLALALALALPSAGHGNDIANFTTITDTDVVSAGYGGMRDDGTGTITISGVSGTVTKAYLYWHGPTNDTTTTDNAAVTFNGNAVSGTFIGASNNNCWGYVESHAFRADVTSYVTGDGSYALAGFLKSSGQVNINGASLIVFFDDGNTANNRDVVIFDGNDSNIPNTYDADGWNVTLAGINYSSGSATMELHVSDGQNFDDDALVVNSSPLVPSGAIFSGDSTPHGPFVDASGKGDLWDIHSYDVSSFLTAGPNTLSLTSGLSTDCLSLVTALVNLPAGAAPPVGTIPTTTTYGGDSTVQYSDVANLSGTLTKTSDSSGIAGKTLDFTLGTDSPSAGPTDSSGAASTTLQVLQKPGTVSNVLTAFAGDETYDPSGDSDAFSITKEDCTLAYSGDTLVAPATNTTLEADLGEPDSSLGDLSGKQLTFTVVDSSLNSQSFNATTDSSGHASTSQPLADDLYEVSVTFAGDDYYQSCATQADTLVTVQGAAKKVTGGGWINANSVGRTSFGFNVIPQDGNTFQGQFQLRSNSGKNKFHGNTAQALIVSSNHASWNGTGRWNGMPGYHYYVWLTDNGGSGSKKLDTIRVVIKNPAETTTVFTTDSTETALKGGNLTIHK